MEKKDYKALLEGGYIEIDCFTEEELNQLFQILNEKMQIIYDFVLGYMDYINERHNYSSDEKLTMLEAHLLTDICDAPNMTVTTLAHAWHRSTSATSQTIHKLIKKELIERVNSKEDAKVFFLKPTKKGLHISNAHKRYDSLDIIKTFKSLKHDLSPEELDTMFKGLEVYTKLLHKSKISKKS